jgi:hypothetical protein
MTAHGRETLKSLLVVDARAPAGVEASLPDAATAIAREAKVAILSFHSHGDRSFLDDQRLALLSGDLRADGIENELVLVVLDPAGGDGPAGRPAEARLIEALRAFDVVVYERVWSRELILRLREALPGRVWIACRGEHVLEAPVSDWVLDGDLRQMVPGLLHHLRGDEARPPSGSWYRQGGRFTTPGDILPWFQRDRPWAPNLRPLVVNPEALPAMRTFSVSGNRGCPYQADARENPLYAGAELPTGTGRGCAFCTTGNDYQGRPATDAAASVFEQIRYVRANAPELDHLVLKDQNPFGYLTEVMERLAAEGVAPFTLLLETRADWFLRSGGRFERALRHAGEVGVRIAPYLVGIENFSQPELDRFNKGIDAALNVRFLEALDDWAARFPQAFTLEHASFGFILYTPWTTLADLRTNLEAVKRTRLDRFRGSILLARARLYADTALYYLAKRDGLFAERFRSDEDDSSRRYGYAPSQPWRFLHPETAHFSDVAVQVAQANGLKDQVALFELLLTAFESAADYREVTAEAVLGQYRARQGPRREEKKPASEAIPVAPAELRRRFVKMIAPIPEDAPFAEGWRLGELFAGRGKLQVHLTHAAEAALVVELVSRTEGPAFARSRHYDIRHVAPDPTAAQRAALEAISAAIVRNDR